MNTAPEVLPDGSLRSPDGIVHRETPERVRRRNGRELIGAGAVVVTDVYPDGLTFYPASDAVDLWNGIEPDLVIGRPPRDKYEMWTGRVWRSDNGAPLLLLRGHH